MRIGGFKGDWLVGHYVIEEFGLPISATTQKLRGLTAKIITANAQLGKAAINGNQLQIPRDQSARPKRSMRHCQNPRNQNTLRNYPLFLKIHKRMDN